MTTHKLAELLLKQPDIPVVINGWSSDEGMGPFEVTMIETPKEESVMLSGEDRWVMAVRLNYD